MPQPFTIAIPDERLAVIRSKVAAFDWDTVPDAGGWTSGVGIADLRHLVEYWLQTYDWRMRQAYRSRAGSNPLPINPDIVLVEIKRQTLTRVRPDGNFLADVLPATIVGAIGMSLAYIPVMMAALPSSLPEPL